MLILEAKFWAGLTEAQPLEYIRRLSSDNGSTLSFIVPDARIESLWRELFGRILGEHPAAQIIESAGSTIKALKIDSARYVSITSWSSLTDAVLEVLDRNGDLELAGDVRQLAGLCAAMDDDAFLPLQGHETGPEVPRRIRQLYGLVERVVQHAQTEGLANTTGMQAAADSDGWGRYFQFGDSNVWLGVKFSLWASEADTPIWFRFQDSALGRFREVSKGYSGWELEQRPRLIYDERNIPSFPIYLEYGMERDQLVEAIVGQIKSICAPLKRSPGHTLG
jgi:hypothetical protein